MGDWNPVQLHPSEFLLFTLISRAQMWACALDRVPLRRSACLRSLALAPPGFCGAIGPFELDVVS